MAAVSLRNFLLFAVFCASVALCAPRNWNYDTGRNGVHRLKRNPLRTWTYSGFNTHGGLTALSSSAYMPHYYGYSSQLQPQYSQYPMQSNFDSDAPQSPQLNPDADGVPVGPASQQDGGPDREPKQLLQDYNPSAEEPLKPSNDPSLPVGPAEQVQELPLKLKTKANQVEGDDDDDDKSSKSKSNARASFNAWFPIVLGTHGTSKLDAGENGQGRHRNHGTTVIANSVANGRQSVASSHAIAYGGVWGGELPSRASSLANNNNNKGQ